MADNQFFGSDIFKTKPVRAIWPKLEETDKFGNYSVSADVMNDPELKATITAQGEATLKAAHEKLGVQNIPGNSFFRSGKDKKTDAPFEQVGFKTKPETRKGKSLKPAVIDANRLPMIKEVFGGSLVQIQYYILFSIVNGNCNMSLKLKAVQVLELVETGGRLAEGAEFEVVEGGYVSPPVEEDGPGACDPDSGSIQEPAVDASHPMPLSSAAQSGSDF